MNTLRAEILSVCVCVFIGLQLTSGVNLFDQASPFGMKRHSGCLFQLLGRVCGYKKKIKLRFKTT